MNKLYNGQGHNVTPCRNAPTAPPIGRGITLCLIWSRRRVATVARGLFDELQAGWRGITLCFGASSHSTRSLIETRRKSSFTPADFSLLRVSHSPHAEPDVPRLTTKLPQPSKSAQCDLLISRSHCNGIRYKLCVAGGAARD